MLYAGGNIGGSICCRKNTSIIEMLVTSRYKLKGEETYRGCQHVDEKKHPEFFNYAHF
jgi:hypothetical protein